MTERNRASTGQETAEELRLPARTGWATGLLNGLSSGKLALVLIVLLILFSVVGAMVPQDGLFSKTDIGQWREAHPLATSLLAPPGLFHVFHSWPFLITIVVLAVNTLTCTVLFLTRQGGFGCLIGPMAARRCGFLALHLSLILLFAGGLLSAAANLDGKIVLIEGQTFTDEHDNYLQLQEGPLRTERHTGVAVRLKQVNIDYEQQRYRMAVGSQLEVLNAGEVVTSGVVEVNHPFIHQGLSFTQDETGFAPRLEIRDAARNRTMVDSFIALETARTEQGREYRDFLPLPFLKRRVVVSLFPSFVRDGDEVRKAGDAPDKPMLVFNVEGDFGEVVETHYAELGGQVRIGAHTFGFTDLRQWASFRVGHDPGYLPVCWALWLGLAAMILRYYPDLRAWYGESSAPLRITASPSPQPVPVGDERDMMCASSSQ